MSLFEILHSFQCIITAIFFSKIVEQCNAERIILWMFQIILHTVYAAILRITCKRMQQIQKKNQQHTITARCRHESKFFKLSFKITLFNYPFPNIISKITVSGDFSEMQLQSPFQGIDFGKWQLYFWYALMKSGTGLEAWVS